MSGFSNVKYMKIVTKLTPLLKSRTLGINTCRAKELRNNIIDINIDQFLSEESFLDVYSKDNSKKIHSIVTIIYK